MTDGGTRFDLRNLLGRGSDIRTLALLLVVLMATFAILLPGEFLRAATFQSMAFQLPELGLLALAMAVTMLTGGINLSIIATANMCGIVTAAILTRMVPADTVVGMAESGYIVLAIAAGLATSLLLGLLNGFVVAYLGVSPILATLGTMTLIDGTAVLLTKGRVISGFPEAVLVIGNGDVMGFPIPMIIFLATALVVSILLNRTPWGLSVYMIGSNQTATEFSGVRVRSVLMQVYMLSGILCGLSSLIMISRFNSAKSGYAASYLLVTVLASVLGGVDPSGGFGRVPGLILALAVLQVVSSGLNLLGVSSHLTVALWGAIIIFITSLNLLRSSRGLSKRSA